MSEDLPPSKFGAGYTYGGKPDASSVRPSSPPPPPPAVTPPQTSAPRPQLPPSQAASGHLGISPAQGASGPTPYIAATPFTPPTPYVAPANGPYQPYIAQSAGRRPGARGKQPWLKLLAVVVALVFVVVVVKIVNGLIDPKFDVGDCVIPKISIGQGHDLKKAECRSTRDGTPQWVSPDFRPGDTVYRITKIVALNGTCPRATDLTFNHEPHDVTYCLDQV